MIYKKLSLFIFLIQITILFSNNNINKTNYNNLKISLLKNEKLINTFRNKKRQFNKIQYLYLVKESFNINIKNNNN